MNRFYDTSSLLKLGEKAFDEPFVTSSIVIKELEHIKTSKNKTEDLRFKARQLVRLFDTYTNYEVITQTIEHERIVQEYNLPLINDNLIVAAAYDYYQNNPNLIFITNDLILKLTASNIFKIPSDKIKEAPSEKYKGYKDVCLSNEDMGALYSNLDCNYLGLNLNQYIIIRNSEGNIVELRKWDGESNKIIQYKNIVNDYTGKLTPINIHQKLAFDMLQNKDILIKVLTGKQGSGKDTLMITHALDLILRKHKYDKLVWIRNTVEVKDTKQLGYLPGTLHDKLMPFAQILTDHVGGQEGLDRLISEGHIELQHLGLARGRDIKNAIIYCSEAENLTTEHIQLLMGRTGAGSSLWLNGDTKQTDSITFKTNNGLDAIVNNLKGHKNFGMVELTKCERSEVAAMADLLD